MEMILASVDSAEKTRNGPLYECIANDNPISDLYDMDAIESISCANRKASDPHSCRIANGFKLFYF